jgi:thioesterase domain-containing protein
MHGGDKATADCGEKFRQRLRGVSAIPRRRSSGVFFPGADLEPPYLRHLAISLQPRQPFIALRHRLTDPRDFPELAARAATLIRGIRARGPLVVAGHCYGGILAYETANRLIGESKGSVAIVLINAPAPGFAKIKLKRYLQYLPSAAVEI